MQIKSRQAFTVIELMISISVISILLAIATVSFDDSRRNSRDGRRKADVQSYTNALSAYRVASGSFFVTQTGQPCTVPSASPSDANPAPVTGGSCTGALGRSYGKMNLTALSDGTRPYWTNSIATTLRDLGYLGQIAKDPSAPATNGIDQPDYVLLRCCPDGSQTINTGGSIFSVFTMLERAPSVVDNGNTGKLCGGSGLGVDFATIAKYGSNRTSNPGANPYGIGNSIPDTTAGNYAGICSN